MHNLTEGIVLVVIVLFLFLGNARGALIVALTIPFSLLFASICLDPASHSSQPSFSGSVGLRDGRRRRGGNGREHCPPLESSAVEKMRLQQKKSKQRRTKYNGLSSTRSASSSQRIYRSSRCSLWKGASSSRWPGRSRLLCLAR